LPPSSQVTTKQPNQIATKQVILLLIYRQYCLVEDHFKIHSYVLDIKENDCNLLFFCKRHFSLDSFLNIFVSGGSEMSSHMHAIEANVKN
jgi:hypothetical protein